MYLINICLLWIATAISPGTATNGQLIIEVDQVEIAKGKIWIGIYDSKDNYLVKERAIIKELSIQQTGKAQLLIPKLPYGTYAIALFHDINENNELDQNFWGLPTEPYAFSRPPISKWRIPYFHEVAFKFRFNGQQVKASLRRWHQ
jgi:uncharacterized protein (DUF2141 family)